MTKDRSRDYAASLGLCLAVMAGEIPAPGKDGTTDPWIKVTPRGPVTTRDGRSFTFDPDTLVDRFKADGVDLPADFDHGIARNAINGKKTPAIGWATDLQGRDDGTYAKMDWLADGKQALADRTHRYVSPTFHHDPAGNATWVHSISLTTAPALTMPALADALAIRGASTDLATLAALLGLGDRSDLGSVLKAAARAIDASVPKATHEATLAALTATTERLNGLSASTRKADVEATVDKALRELKITPAQRDGFIAMCATEAGLETFKGIMAATMPLFRPSGLDGKTPPGADRAATAQAILDRAAIYRADKAKLGVQISLTDAISAIAHQPAG